MSESAIVQSNIQGLDERTFLYELLPAAEKTALLYHISYHCLGNFPELERIIRANAVKAQMAFNSSEALLWQCISTSDNLVTSLFPMLKIAVEKEIAVLAISYLEKARRWIQEIIRDVQAMVDRYGQLNEDVANAASDVITTKDKTDKLKAKMNKEQAAIQDNVTYYEGDVKTKEAKLAETEKNIKTATEELEAVIKDIAARNKKFGIVAAVIPFIGAIINAAQNAINNPDDNSRLETARLKITGLREERTNLSRDVGQAQAKQMDWQFQLTKSFIDLGAVPDPVYLPQVQQNLSRIQDILLQLRSFWEKIGVMVKSLEQKTFSGEGMVQVLKECKPEFLESISAAKMAWIDFKKGCKDVSVIFTVQNKDAYKFLHTSPSSLSAKEWQKQYDDLKKQLEKFYTNPPAVQAAPSTASAK